MKVLAALLIMGSVTVPTLGAHAQAPCAELQRACEMKRQLGEQGEGNCRKARACVERVCERLRRACMFKNERGEEGEGNCKRYRAVCRSG